MKLFRVKYKKKHGILVFLVIATTEQDAAKMANEYTAIEAGPTSIEEISLEEAGVIAHYVDSVPLAQ